MRLPHGLEVPLATAVKRVVSVSVMTANRIVTPQEAEDIVEQGRADLIGIGRGLIADPEWPKKAQEGRADEIRYCIGCMDCLKKILEEKTDLRCAINAAVGQEGVCKVVPAAEAKRVFVAGGGPAGLEAARVLALRGHTVRLFERDKLGGQLLLASAPHGKDDMRLFVDYEARQMSNLGIQIEHRELTSEIVSQETPDAVIIATGAQPVMQPLPGIEKNHVVTAWQVLKGEMVSGNKVAILGGGEIGAETAEHLALQGKQVMVVEMLDTIAADMDRTSQLLLLFSLNDLGVRMLTRATAKEIVDRGVLIDNRGKQELLEADTVVLALGAQPHRELADRIQALGIESHLVGDCVEPRRSADAVREAFETALRL
jgi:NADPH-dependent 2,4-dienoyl-CoA reductase/sulfur reductase-like enzyme